MYQHSTVAGTFDHLHAGHRYLLELACSQSHKVSIGIATDTLYKDKTLASVIEPYERRKHQVEQFLQMNGYAEKAEVFSLTDIFGIALSDKTLDAIYVTPDTEANAKTINRERTQKGLPPLQVITALMKEGDDDEIISSTRIRMGIINREGESYLMPFTKKERFIATQLVQDDLRDPVDRVITGSETDLLVAGREIQQLLKKQKPVMVITVGDVVTQTLRNMDILPDIAVIDFKSRRKILQELIQEHELVRRHTGFHNKTGVIESRFVHEYVTCIQDVFASTNRTAHQIEVDGEEDLLGLPALMLAPLGSVVLYGHFEYGVVYTTITEEIKEFCKTILSRFK